MVPMQLSSEYRQILTDFFSYCIEHQLRVCCAESLTSGNLQAAFGSISGISKIFAGGITAYNLEQKSRHLGVDREEAILCNCVSQAIADQMARGACELFDADIAFTTTGYAQPSEEYGVEIPFAFVSCYSRRDQSFLFQDKIVGTVGISRTEMQVFVVEQCIELIDKNSIGNNM